LRLQKYSFWPEKAQGFKIKLLSPAGHYPKANNPVQNKWGFLIFMLKLWLPLIQGVFFN